jgi:polar amino acid transport system substrate-binding protein
MRHLIAFVVALVISYSATFAAERKLEIAATEWPPFYGKDLENNGFMTEIILEAFKRVGYEVSVKFLPWKRALKGTKSGKHDGLYSVYYRKEREEWFVYSAPLPANEWGFFKHKDADISFETFEDLKPYTIGVVRGYVVPPGFDEAELKTALANDDEQNLRKLHKRRLDLVLTDKIVAKYIMKTKIPDAISDLEWLDPPVSTEIQYLVFSKQSPDYETNLSAFNKGLAEIEADGTLRAIMAKHGF